ncbi:MAG: peptidase domain-containing ABC transporter [Flavobacterium nitrogenifigens]|uniref:peptidase domain-containing ABC transporter n=1 Tax=Flavobacterium nitrogenifigens TaxID=1617283 RepID=UPI002807B28B|nr:peptidase domain-containing ABC transporter [Flavobacterium nitrogenifigens]MDQ8013218.1 peptidase domain-containing ABC transporter [Flavobacterium nitrogenifigens]
MKTFPNVRQTDQKDCGPTCLKIIAKNYGKTIGIQELRKFSETTREGSNLLFLSDAAEKIGFRTLGVKLTLESLEEAPLPCILHWNSNHYVVLYKIKRGIYYISDPAFGLIECGREDFLKFWIGNNADGETEEGIALLVETTPKFFQSEFDKGDNKGLGFGILSQYVLRYRSFLIQLAIGLFAGSLLSLIFPFLTQSIVDVGIQNQNINFIYLILFAQLFLFAGRTGLELIRSWILLHISTRINISLISDFFIKLMNLPISFFDVRMAGDIMQRINDHHRIEKILTTSSLNVVFSVINMFVLGAVLAYFNLKIFLVFFAGSFLYFGWITMFLKRREALDYKRFAEISNEQGKVMELISGMQEIKLHNAEKQKRWSWEYVQARLFRVSIKGLVLEQTQTVGSSVINELKNIFITFLSAKLVIDGSITLGMMLAINSIVGSLNGPITQLIQFVRELQDAKISLARLSEIHEKDDEAHQEEHQSHDVPYDSDIELKNVSYRYLGSDAPVLDNLSLKIPANKVTAIVGASGSGKTTLMKLLLKFYEPEKGEISIGNAQLKNIAQKAWRSAIGTVMQEGFIFSDSIANNIAIGSDKIDKERLVYASDAANIRQYISELPLGYNTRIGAEGLGMSTGQKQRLLIARAVYKNPEILFFDEATSALDANNEKEIMNKLDVFFKNKTVVVIAHRLSTVMNADQIVVLDKGKIIEIGSHSALVEQKGNYFELVRNQLQLGN